ncbi:MULTISPECIES: energy-coupling factor transporter transmembrane protein EcfT [Metallosphaera]|uniref:energy-coupling factor transporter transmembrane component T family protein n=1 Tax=Metallosphaera TaxID=41980 RepID=UPI001F056406|nr:energy-coupling factor transporter transmembrane protein EcfT [Metallosphaera sedula]MCH1771547.1 energy-coupling factor transporter transmembrane protein EcfT [Metallosphaera sedula]
MSLITTLISWFLFFYGVGFPVLLIVSVVRLKGFMEITRYESGTGFMYRVNPVTKVLLGLAVMGVASTTVWWIGALLTLAISLVYLTLRDGVRKLVYLSVVLVSSLISSMWSVAPYVTPSILELAFPHQNLVTVWTWPSYFEVMGYQPNLALQALMYGLQIGFRVTAVLASALILVLTTTTSDIFRMFTKLRAPLSLTFSLLVGVRTVPRIFELLDSSVKMQFIRGLGRGKPRIVYPFLLLYSAILALVPTMVYLLRGAKTMAISADTRGFRALPRRTEIVELGFGKEDYVIFGLVVGLILLAIVANMLGFGRSVPYLGV